MKIIKTDWRSCLLDVNLSDLLMVLLETPEVGNFDPSEAICLWNAAGPRARRPNYVSEMEDENDVEEQDSDFVSAEMQQMEDRANHELEMNMMD